MKGTLFLTIFGLLMLAFGLVTCGHDDEGWGDGDADADTDSDADSDSDSDTDTDTDDSSCGPCGSVQNGDTEISSDARIDGMFMAVVQLKQSVDSIKSAFDSDVQELASAFMTEAEIDASVDLVADLKVMIEANIAAHVQGGLTVLYTPSICSADLQEAYDAQAQCEAKLGCETGLNPDETLSVECDGLCLGSCNAECSGEMKCQVSMSVDGSCKGSCEGVCSVSAPDMACEGMCRGGCVVEGSGSCEGTCKGECSGECSATNTQGDCEGECNGKCQGTCSIEVKGPCSGECQGTCEFMAPDNQCEGDCKGDCTIIVETAAECESGVLCQGQCSGKCTDGCMGEARPPSQSLDCDASADCNAQASARASAGLDCSSPSLDIGFSFSAALDADARAEFTAKMDLFKTKMTSILEGYAELKGLAMGNAELGIEPPVVTLSSEIQGLLVGGVSDFNIPGCRMPCVIPAFEESVTLLAKTGVDSKVVIEGQVTLASIIL